MLLVKIFTFCFSCLYFVASQQTDTNCDVINNIYHQYGASTQQNSEQSYSSASGGSQVLSMTGPQGRPGKQGPIGVTGEKGEQGTAVSCFSCLENILHRNTHIPHNAKHHWWDN